MKDPTKQELLNFILPISHGDLDDCEIAIYYFAEAYHRGQGSNLYSILSTSPFTPGPLSSLDGESDFVKMLFEELEGEFG